MTATTAETVTRIIAESLCTDPANVTPDAKLADLGADSLDVVEIAFEIETALNLDAIPTAALDELGTVSDLIRTVEGMVA